MLRSLRFIVLGLVLAWTAPSFAQMSFEGLDLSTDEQVHLRARRRR